MQSHFSKRVIIIPHIILALKTSCNYKDSDSIVFSFTRKFSRKGQATIIELSVSLSQIDIQQHSGYGDAFSRIEEVILLSIDKKLVELLRGQETL